MSSRAIAIPAPSAEKRLHRLLAHSRNVDFSPSCEECWLVVIARINPLSYEVDALRALMIAGAGSVFGVGTDFVVLISSTAILVAIATRVYQRVVT
jgi:ABC-2 type transport system permease protein